MFLVIEGDNASGKTTLSIRLKEEGFHIITDDENVKKLELGAKQNQVGTWSRINSFYAYNAFCGEQTKNYENSVLVRYWVSTVAAAYADGLVTLAEAIDMAKKWDRSLPKPDFYFRLRCCREDRIARIKERYLKNDYSDSCSDVWS